MTGPFETCAQGPPRSSLRFERKAARRTSGARFVTRARR
jgi:hypothetical protein